MFSCLVCAWGCMWVYGLPVEHCELDSLSPSVSNSPNTDQDAGLRVSSVYALISCLGRRCILFYTWLFNVTTWVLQGFHKNL
ncbi:hypothetical protein SCHPADRAFT_301572 [Schizopora paradoxa]|uniref:Secreted protein n=1 Tax=Schizopora paradoxa TaxID=27342 RepID=A0A0H2RSS9_9AGAM|nr:hypothetical protein SCHPADRAFT_301572 [Schizopora paradoxa]